MKQKQFNVFGLSSIMLLFFLFLMGCANTHKNWSPHVEEAVHPLSGNSHRHSSSMAKYRGFSEEPMPLNDEEQINEIDLEYFFAALWVQEHDDVDVNQDGDLNQLDVDLLMANWGPCSGGCDGDLNEDGVIDDFDLRLLSWANWIAHGGDVDYNDDEVVDSDDLVILLMNQEELGAHSTYHDSFASNESLNKGPKVTVLVNHLKSKSGSDPREKAPDLVSPNIMSDTITHPGKVLGSTKKPLVANPVISATVVELDKAPLLLTPEKRLRFIAFLKEHPELLKQIDAALLAKIEAHEVRVLRLHQEEDKEESPLPNQRLPLRQESTPKSFLNHNDPILSAQIDSELLIKMQKKETQLQRTRIISSVINTEKSPVNPSAHPILDPIKHNENGN